MSQFEMKSLQRQFGRYAAYQLKIQSAAMPPEPVLRPSINLFAFGFATMALIVAVGFPLGAWLASLVI